MLSESDRAGRERERSATRLPSRELNGRPSELDTLSGGIVRLGQEVAVNTPVHEFIYHALLPLELKARGQIDTAA